MATYEVEVTLRGTYTVDAENEEDACERGLAAASEDPDILYEDASATLVDEDEAA